MKVLIIEDTESDAEFARRKLSAIPDIETRTEVTLREGSDSVLDFMPDLILLDVNLPDSGPEKLRDAIRSLRGWAAVVPMTSRHEDDYRAEVEADGADEYLPKRYLTDPNGRLFLTRIIRGYSCFRDRKPDNDRNVKVDKALTKALQDSKVIVATSLNDEQTDLILTTLRALVPEVKEMRGTMVKVKEGVDHTNGTVKENTAQLQAHELALEEIRLRHRRIDDEKSAAEKARIAMEKDIADKKLAADKKAAQDRTKMLNWLKVIAGGVLTLLCTYVAHALGWNK